MSEIKDKLDYLKLAITISNLVRKTLGPKGMNKMLVGEKNQKVIMTNDGATIMKNLKINNPLGQVFKNLAISQEEAIGDGTTTAILLTGQLLEQALEMLNKNIHQTNIINGYNLARNFVIKYLDSVKETCNKEKVIRTVFGSKVNLELANHLTKLLLEVTDYENLKIFKLNNENQIKTELIDGYVMSGYTLNERMPKQVKGKIAIADFKTTLDNGKFSITNSDELEKLSQKEREYKKRIVNNLDKEKVKCLFYTDTNPEFETYLTEKNIQGIVAYKRDDLDFICKVTGATAISDPNEVSPHLGEGEVIFEKNPNRIYITKEKTDFKTLVLCGTQEQVLDEYERAVDDAIRVLKHLSDVVLGAGSVEIDMALALREFSKKIGGKEQVAVEKFAEAIESIPMILAENCGLDAMEVITALKTMHSGGDKDMGVDAIQKISDARERGILEPVLMKMHAIATATDVSTLILKLDEVLIGEDEKEN